MLHFGLKLFKKIGSFTTLKEENFAERKFKLVKFPVKFKRIMDPRNLIILKLNFKCSSGSTLQFDKKKL